MISSLTHNQLNVVVLNFVDMLSHARTEMKMIRELAQSEAAYRSPDPFLVPTLDHPGVVQTHLR